jgi:NagD protein
MYFIDVQGTLIDDLHQKPIPGAVEFIDELNRRKIPYVIITNNTKNPRFLDYLRSLGFKIPAERYIDPLQVLKKVLPQNRVAAYGVERFLETLRALGYELDYQNPEAVVLSVRDDYTFKEFGQIDEFLLGGAKLYGMHGTSLYAKDLRYPGVGALLAMFSFATGAEPVVVGKPSRLFFEEALKKLGAKDFDEVTIISDDPKGDLAGAKELGMRTVLVLSGKVKRADEIHLPPEQMPDAIYVSVAEAAKELL